ncbi:hypothetical protein PENTCL1PPCAC_500, partial [Pristionchus entomophagus]
GMADIQESEVDSSSRIINQLLPCRRNDRQKSVHWSLPHACSSIKSSISTCSLASISSAFVSPIVGTLIVVLKLDENHFALSFYT